MMHKVLFVDDDPLVLRSMLSITRGLCEPMTVTNGLDALEVLGTEEIAVIVTDQRMPGMLGTELLEQSALRSPLSVRLLMTAHADLDAAIDAVNQGHIFKYLQKPFSHELLAEVLRTAIEHYDIGKEALSLGNDIGALDRKIAARAGERHLAETVVGELPALHDLADRLISLRPDLAPPAQLELSDIVDELRQWIVSLHLQLEPESASSEGTTNDIQAILDLALKTVVRRYPIKNVLTNMPGGQDIVQIEGTHGDLVGVFTRLLAIGFSAAAAHPEAHLSTSLSVQRADGGLAVVIGHQWASASTAPLSLYAHVVAEDEDAAMRTAMARELMASTGGSLKVDPWKSNGVRFECRFSA